MRQSTSTVKKGTPSHAPPFEAAGMSDPRPRDARARRSAVGHGTDNAPWLRSQRQSLLAMRNRLRGDVTQAAEEVLSNGVETTSASPDTADRASESIEQDVALSLLGNATGALDQIETALERIEDGSYGRCAQCGTEIPPVRLEAIPYAACCVHCAARKERAA
jgi:DnaK suppressor protein